MKIKNKIITQMFKQMPKENFNKPSPTMINLAEDLLEKGDLQGEEHWEEQTSQRTFKGNCRVVKDVNKIEEILQKESKGNFKHPKTMKAITKFFNKPQGRQNG